MFDIGFLDIDKPSHPVLNIVRLQVAGLNGARLNASPCFETLC